MRGHFELFRSIVLKWILQWVTLGIFVISLPCPSIPSDMGYNPKGNLDPYIGKGNEDGFRFWVFGDTKSNTGNIEIFEDILEKAKREKPLFLVLLGDFFPKGTEEEYRFFLDEVEETGVQKAGIPLFLVLGNHDLDRMDRKPRLFHKFFGPTRYWFSFGNSLFVVVDTGDGVLDGEQLQWIESVLKERRKDFLHAFVFMHVPPINFDIPQNRKLSRGAGEFMSLMERYGVDRVFCGHYHTYRRQSINGGTYILTGGGAKLMDGESFHHYLDMEVNGPRITENIVRLDRSYGISDAFEYFLNIYLFPFILSFWPFLLTAASSSMPLFAMVLLKKRRGKTSGSP